MSSISAERWVTRAIGPPLATAALRAATLLSRPTWRGTIISGKITVSRRATRGSSRMIGPGEAGAGAVLPAAVLLDEALDEALPDAGSTAPGSIERLVRRLVSGFDGLLAIAWFSLSTARGRRGLVTVSGSRSPASGRISYGLHWWSALTAGRVGLARPASFTWVTPGSRADPGGAVDAVVAASG